MKNEIIKQIIKTDQLLLVLSLGYLGLLFAGRADFIIWILLTAILVSGNIAKFLFYFIQQDKKSSAINRGKIILSKRSRNLWLIGIGLCVILIFSAYFINDLCYYISILSVILLLSFPLLKRYNFLPLHNFGIFEAICPLAGFIAVKNRFELLPFILSISILFWISGLEISGAVFEAQNNNLKRNFFVDRFGQGKAQIVSVIYYIFSISLMTAAGILTDRGLAYWIAILCFVIIILKQIFLLKSKDAEISRKESLQINNFVGPAILIGTLVDIFFHR